MEKEAITVALCEICKQYTQQVEDESGTTGCFICRTPYSPPK